MLPFTLTKGEIATVRAISEHNGSSILELSQKMGKSESSVSQRVKSLERKGILDAKRQGMRKLIARSDRNYALSLFDMIKSEPFVPWEELISNSQIAVLFKNITGEESFEHGISSVSLWRSTRNLLMHGMLNTRANGQVIGDLNLSRFISEYSDHVSRKYLSDILPKDAITVWRSGYRCLFKIRGVLDKEIIGLPDDTLPTALSVSPDYGIQFMTQDSFYYHEPSLKELTIEDTIIHTLLIGPESQTYSTYALMLAFKVKSDIDIDLLVSKSRVYGLEGEVKKLVSYLKSRGKKREWPLPKMGELREQADLYGIVIN